MSRMDKDGNQDAQGGGGVREEETKGRIQPQATRCKTLDWDSAPETWLSAKESGQINCGYW